LTFGGGTGWLGSSTSDVRALDDVSLSLWRGEIEGLVGESDAHQCPYCGGRMIIIETFERGCSPRYRPTDSTSAIRIDTS
jgi:ABC-type microcin C transport system duplicated ATPase subunit YejF